jgi:hypothetical protein
MSLPHTDHDRIAAQAQHQPLPPGDQVQDHTVSVLKPQITSTLGAQGEAVTLAHDVPFAVRVWVVEQEASLSVGLGKLAANRSLVGSYEELRLCAFFLVRLLIAVALKNGTW